MPTVTLPVSFISVQSNGPTTKYGEPAWVPLEWGSPYRVALGRVSLDAIPIGATFVSAILRVTLDTPNHPVSMVTLNAAFNSSATWNTGNPATGATQATGTNAGSKTLDLNVTAWAATRNRNGFRLQTTSITPFLVASSKSPYVGARPVLIVTYSMTPVAPGQLAPAAGAVSVPKPVLVYVGDRDMTEQLIEINRLGTIWSSGWVPATRGYFEQPAGAPVLPAGGGVLWRATVRNSQGTSVPSQWAAYTYEPLPVVVITNPGATSADGSPTLQWTASSQTSFAAELRPEGLTAIDRTAGFVAEAATRDWTPSKSIKMPGGVGLFVLDVRDSIVRVAATGAPTATRAVQYFTTTLTGSGSGMSALAMTYEEPVPKLTGTRPAGIPDQISLQRDGVLVPIWNEQGDVGLKMPGADFFTGTAFEVRDYTAPPHGSHTWKVLAWTNGTPSASNPTVTALIGTKAVWLVDPTTNIRVQIFGRNERPAVEQETVESAILHMPISGGPIVEPIRRRLVRSTRSGTINGVVQGGAEDVLDDWANGSSGTKYRLVFGKVNWPVIIGDYSPSDHVFIPERGHESVLVRLGWWERLKD